MKANDITFVGSLIQFTLYSFGTTSIMLHVAFINAMRLHVAFINAMSTKQIQFDVSAIKISGWNCYLYCYTCAVPTNCVGLVEKGSSGGI
jgi:hypothetical protein